MFKLVWEENFQDGALDPAKWSFETGGHGFGNNEAQFYTDRPQNARVENGQLIIEAHKETFENKSFTSAKLTTRDLFDMQYGRIEIVAKLPQGKGTWPAVWMMPSSFNQGQAWPRCGEIDIVEHRGKYQDEIHFSLHTDQHNHGKRNHDTFKKTIEGISGRFAKFTMLWTEEGFEFYIDDELQVTFPKHHNEEDPKGYWPFDQPFYLITNLAIGGYWAGGVDETIFPVRFIIDSIKVFQ